MYFGKKLIAVSLLLGGALPAFAGSGTQSGTGYIGLDGADAKALYEALDTGALGTDHSGADSEGGQTVGTTYAKYVDSTRDGTYLRCEYYYQPELPCCREASFYACAVVDDERPGSRVEFDGNSASVILAAIKKISGGVTWMPPDNGISIDCSRDNICKIRIVR